MFTVYFCHITFARSSEKLSNHSINNTPHMHPVSLISIALTYIFILWEAHTLFKNHMASITKPCIFSCSVGFSEYWDNLNVTLNEYRYSYGSLRYDVVSYKYLTWIWSSYFTFLGMLSTNSNRQIYILPRTGLEKFTNLVFSCLYLDLSPNPLLNITENVFFLWNIVMEVIHCCTLSLC